MMDKTRLAFVVLVFSAQAAVGGELDHNRALREVAAGRALPLSEVVSKAQGSFKGRLLGAQLEEDGQGGLVYKLRMLSDDGRIAKVTVGASTGSVASVQSASGRDAPPVPPRPSEDAGLTGRRAQPQGGSGAPVRQDLLGAPHPAQAAPSPHPAPSAAAPAHPEPHAQTPPPSGHVLRGAPPPHRPPAPPPKQPGVSKPSPPHLHSSPAQPDRRPPPKDGRPSQPERKPHENSDRRG